MLVIERLALVMLEIVNLLHEHVLYFMCYVLYVISYVLCVICYKLCVIWYMLYLSRTVL